MATLCFVLCLLILLHPIPNKAQEYDLEHEHMFPGVYNTSRFTNSTTGTRASTAISSEKFKISSTGNDVPTIVSAITTAALGYECSYHPQNPRGAPSPYCVCSSASTAEEDSWQLIKLTPFLGNDIYKQCNYTASPVSYSCPILPSPS